MHTCLDIHFIATSRHITNKHELDVVILEIICHKVISEYIRSKKDILRYVGDGLRRLFLKNRYESRRLRVIPSVKSDLTSIIVLTEVFLQNDRGF